MNIGKLLTCVACAALAFQLMTTGTATAVGQTPFLGRGIAANGKLITEENLAAFAATGGNLVRLHFQMAPFRDVQPPYAINRANLALLDRDLDWCKKYNLNCIIDPHNVPGLGEAHKPDDAMWSDDNSQKMLADLWGVIAERVANRGSEVAGFDLVNEPAVPAGAKKGSLGDWNALVARLVRAIRAKDSKHPIIIETPDLMQMGRVAMSRSETFRSYLAPPPDPNVIYSIHVYEPYPLTFQRQKGVNYPGRIDGKEWDAQAFAQMFEPIVEFQKRYNVQIYVGEFSCARWAGDPGNRWMRDMLNYFEAHHWSWTYIVWRGADIWDAEKSNYDENDHQRYPSTPRLTLLKSYWKLGRKE